MKEDGYTIKRTLYFDYLRVFATVSVIIVHIAAQNFYSTDVNGFGWQIFNFYDSLVRWGVPIFLMISGALFLNKDIPLKLIYKKYIFRMVISYVVWSAIYALLTGDTITDKIFAFLSGHYHMWFILMIIGIYMCLPIIKAIVENENILKYYLKISFIFSFLLPWAITLTNDFGNELLIKIAQVINQILKNMNMHIVLGYIHYFILGYYLNKITLNKKQISTIYTLGILGFVTTIVFNSAIAVKTQTHSTIYYENFTINVFLESIAVFIWFKYKNYENNLYLNKLMQKLSKYSFGAYLVHVLVIKLLNFTLDLNTLSFNPLLSVILLSFIVTIISFAISSLLNNIPIIKKYIV